MRLSQSTIVISMLFFIAACKGPPKGPSLGSSGDAGPNTPIEGFPGDDPPPEPIDSKGAKEYSILDAECSESDDVRGVRLWRRLTNRELKNTFEDVFGQVNGVNYDFINDVPRKELFDVMALKVHYNNEPRVKSLATVAQTFSEKIDLNKVLPCHKNGAACISGDFAALAEKAYRRPLTAAEKSGFVNLYNSLVKEKFTSEQSVRFIFEALVQSQPFLYRTELGEKQSDGTYRLTSFEVAAALAYGITRRPPDAELYALAKSNKLQDLTTIKAQAKRLLDSDKAKVAMKEFGGMWLGSQKILTQAKGDKLWTEPVRKQYSDEMDAFFSEIFYGNGKGLKDLLSADNVPSSSNSNWPYGSKAENNRLKFTQVDRRGIMGTAAFLAANVSDDLPSPVQRGVYMMSRFLCLGFEPPTEVPATPPAKGESNKDRYLRFEGVGCGDCHKPINQFGFALENFDASGRFITEDAGKPIVTNYKVTIDDKTVPITRADQLPIAIGKSDQLIECYARHVFRYGYGRQEKVPLQMIGPVSGSFMSTKVSEADRCEIHSIAKAVKENKGDMKAGILEAFSNKGFLYRVLSEKN